MLKRIKRETIKEWVFIFVGLLVFITLLLYLMRILGHGSNIITLDLVKNVLTSFPFLIVLALFDYRVVKQINDHSRLHSHVILRVNVEVVYIIISASVFVLLGNISFLIGEDIVGYIKSTVFRQSVIAGILLNIVTVIALELVYHFNKSKQREIEFERLQTDNLNMQYKQLKGQINPHFLFNSLNVLVSLINKDSDRATKYTKKLSDVYRYVLTYDMQDTVKVADEMVFIRNYIDILSIRFEKGLQVEINILEGDLEKEISPMTLQVLLENTVKHNVVSPSKPLRIVISSDSEYITVSNHISPRSKVTPSTGIGLRNLSNKYSILTDRSIIVENNHLQFIVKIPLL